MKTQTSDLKNADPLDVLKPQTQKMNQLLSNLYSLEVIPARTSCQTVLQCR